jgi:Fe-S cluster assembly protein SufB
MEKDKDKIINDVTTGEYKYGFYSDIEMEQIPKGLNEDVIRLISKKKNEPDWLLEFRLKAFRHWQTMNIRQNWEASMILIRS